MRGTPQGRPRVGARPITPNNRNYKKLETPIDSH